MDLVEHLPEAVRVSDSVPPVEDKRPEQPAREALHDRSVQRAQVDKRRLVRKGAVPDLVAGQGEADLTEVDSQRPSIPARCLRERPTRPNPFEDEEGGGRDDGENGGRCEGHTTEASITVIAAGVRVVMTLPAGTAFRRRLYTSTRLSDKGSFRRRFDAAQAVVIHRTLRVRLTFPLGPF